MQSRIAFSVEENARSMGFFASASFGTNSFAYSYLGNTGLVSGMTTANGAAVKPISYEADRDLPTEIKYQTAGENPVLIAKRNYSFDPLGRVSSRSQTRGSDAARNDAFGYNDRSELTSATLGADSYAYAFDDIGNRLTAEELAAETEYASNNLNQYSQIAKEGEAAFSPTYDDDGNQTLVKTSTGIWSVEYNGENRPVKFANGTTVVECKYDAQGRRYEKKVTVDGVTTFWQRYAYRNYLQIAAFDVSLNPDANEEVLTLATTTAWDPAEPQATRPLAFTDYSAVAPATYFHTHDLTKNVCELLDATGAIVASYDYAPFGAVALSGTSTRNPFQFSSEVHDPETALVYYNYRHYNPLDGRWISREPLGEINSINLYAFIYNISLRLYDYLGLERKKENCFKMHFYITRNDAYWARNEDNNYMSHVSISTSGKTDKPVGFYPTGYAPWHLNFDRLPPEYNGEIVTEKRNDEVAHISCCCLTDEELEEIDRFINDTKGKDTYKGRGWTVNQNNCATYVYDAVKGKGINPVEVNWDSDILENDIAARPAELFEAFSKMDSCETYLAPNRDMDSVPLAMANKVLGFVGISISSPSKR